MKIPSCPHEDDVLRAVRSGRWEEALRAHAAGCPTCAEVALVSAWMQRLAQTADLGAPIPDPSALWRRAQATERMLAREAAARRAMRPIRIAEGVALAAAALGAVVGLQWWAENVLGQVGGLTARWAEMASGLSPDVASLALPLLAGALLSALSLLAFRGLARQCSM